MHFSTILLASLSAGALAVPTPSDSSDTITTNSTLLEKRTQKAFISAYADPACGGHKQAGVPVVNLAGHHTGCLKWPDTAGVISGPNIGIQWGTGDQSVTEIIGYTDNNCQDNAVTVVQNGKELGACVNLKDWVSQGKALNGPDGYMPWASIQVGQKPACSGGAPGGC